ncbi:MAG TPA: chemotaxis protein CheA [Terriglobales bacterium]|nr:chemotaxis protein CheA [Terriglobales bacterium]
MSFLSDDRGAELRALFFESAAEILQTINDAGLQLEKRPGDEELIRGVRRAVHTLKGDSAACGFSKLSEIAHELEDVLTPQIALAQGAKLAEVVFSAVDTFESMLGAYRKQAEPQPPVALRALIQDLLSEPGTAHNAVKAGAASVPARFDWSEYEQLMISEAQLRGDKVFNIALRVDPNSAMRAAAFQLIRNVLHACGTVIALRPEDNQAAASVEIVEAALSSKHPILHVSHRCQIPAVVSDIRIEEAEHAEASEHALLGDLLEAEAAQITSRTAETPEAAPANPAAAASAVTTVTEASLRVDAGRIDAVMNLVGELIIGKSMLNRTLSEFDVHHARDPIRVKLAEALAFQSRVLDELHKCVLKIRMVPVEQLFRRFPRVVRDIAKTCGKDVALEVSGEHTDLDKGILDALSEPLTHLVRNAVDHGIEPADERLSAGKPARGTVSLNAHHQGTQVVIEIRDDGRGIDLELIRKQAIRNGMIKEDDAGRMADQDVMNLIFEPGFSTASEVTEVSGRGVGMDVVRTVLDRLKGSVYVNSSKSKGTSIQLRVPLTLASIQTLLFRVGGRLFAVPLSAVVEITRIHDQEIHQVDKREVLRLRDQILTLVRLNELNKIHPVESPNSKKTKHFVVVIGLAEKRFGLVVDSMVGEEELVIKALPGEIVSSDLVSGASILGDGTVVLILNVPAILSRLARSLPLGAIA